MDNNTVSIDRLKPFHGPDPVPQLPPCCGWPPHPAMVSGPVPAPVPMLPAVPLQRNPPHLACTATLSPLP